MSLKGPFSSPDDTYDGRGVRPVVLDILGPDQVESVLPLNLKLVLHVNPSSMTLSYTKTIQRLQTRGGWVEQHWGEMPAKVSLTAVTGGFKRLYSGLSNVTGSSHGGSRRETLAYDRYLDLLALFRNNGVVYDVNGRPVFSGAIKMSFDEGIFIGWFETFSVKENATSPFMFSLDASFVVKHEIVRIRSLPYIPPQQGTTSLEEPFSITHIPKTK